MKLSRKVFICAAACFMTLAAAVPAASYAAENNDDTSESAGEFPGGLDDDGPGVLDGWEYADDGKIYYVDAEGNWLTGEQVIDGVPYLFSNNGVLKTGWRTVGGKRRYYDHETGKPVYGWMLYCGKEYYIEPDEGKAVGVSANEKGDLMLFSEKGDLKTDPGFVSYEDDMYYVSGDGTLACGEVTIDGLPYIFSEGGVESTGWVNISGKRYYFDPETGENQMGFFIVDGKGYYADSENGLALGNVVIDGVDYLFHDLTGELKTGLLDINGNVRLYAVDGTYATGIVEYGGGYRFFAEDGCMQKGLFTDGDDLYYTGADGVLVSGKTVIGEDEYFFDETSFKAWKGFNKINGEDGAYTVYFNADGIKAYGFTEIDGSTYYFDGNTGAMIVGKAILNDKKYYFTDDGKMQTGWQTIDEKKYYFDESGVMASGITEIDGKKYYFNPETGVMDTGKLIINKKKYYFDPADGTMQTGWVTIDKAKYYFDAEGVMKTGWVEINKKKYYFDTASGKMVVNKIVDDYNLAADGHAVPLSNVQQRAKTLLKTTGTTTTGIYNYITSHNYYKLMESTRTLDQIEEKGWSYFANYALDNPYVVCYYFAAVTDLLFQQAGYTTRIVYGTGRATSDHYWNQVLLDGKWVNYDTCNGFNGVTMPTLEKANYTVYKYVNAKFYQE